MYKERGLSLLNSLVTRYIRSQCYLAGGFDGGAPLEELKHPTHVIIPQEEYDMIAASTYSGAPRDFDSIAYWEGALGVKIQTVAMIEQEWRSQFWGSARYGEIE